MSRRVLGLGGSDHDFSAALLIDDDIRVAIEQERLSRRRHGVCEWFQHPVDAPIRYCLDSEGLSLSDVDLVASSDVLPARVRRELSGSRFREYGHHLCHAASAYLLLEPGTRAGVLVIDGYGSIVRGGRDDPLRVERETVSLFVFHRDGHEVIGTNCGLAYREEDDFPTLVTNSIGMLYELVTGILGFAPTDAGKTMGLASYGMPRYVDLIREFTSLSPDPSRCFQCDLDKPGLYETLSALLSTRRDTFATRADIAASLQSIVAEAFVHCAGLFPRERLDTLCLAGGCALNAVATTHLVEHNPLGIPIVVPPYCDDAGIAFGALWLAEAERLGHPPHFTAKRRPPRPHAARLGRVYSLDERRTAANSFYPRLSLDASVSGPGDLARLLARGAVIGVHNGSSEIGPRALGGRSILGDPRSVAVRERLNRVVKQREPFRPLAPMVLAEDYSQYFEDERLADPFMLRVARANARCRVEAPAVVHVDGTARVQVVFADGDPFLIDLLRAFRLESGVGVLLNTSFNRRGEPIVETPADAMDAFLGMGLDGLYVDGDFYRPSDGASPRDRQMPWTASS